MKWIFAIGPEPAVCSAPDRVENLLASLSLKDVPAPLRALLTPTRTASWGVISQTPQTSPVTL
jgi:hypothetical protein